ncbi:hypothetical protein BDQ17DRAFT_215875 [Cyathus striatus]|nr:hypothetical protein BDQ17DRAFT_215875 [Cyathus striatus]
MHRGEHRELSRISRRLGKARRGRNTIRPPALPPPINRFPTAHYLFHNPSACRSVFKENPP